MKINKWLIVRFSTLGDLTLCTAVIDYWYKNKGWKFVVLTKKEFAPIFLHNPAVDKVEVFVPEKNNFYGLCKYFKKISEQYKDFGLIDLHVNLRSFLLTLFWQNHVKRYQKFAWLRRIFLLFKAEFAEQRLLKYNVSQRYLLSFSAFDMPEQIELRPKIYLSEKEKLEAKSFFNCISKNNKIVAIHPYAKHNQKTWNKKKWQELIDLLLADDFIVTILGVNSSSLFVNKPDQGLFDLTNRTDLRQTCALLNEVFVLVTADSGPMHLASAVDTPVFALFGPTTKHWGFFPVGERDVVFETDLECRPCSLHGKKQCLRSEQCLNELNPVFIYEQIIGLVNSSFKSGSQ